MDRLPLLDVKTSDLTKALKHLVRFERGEQFLSLCFREGLLTLQLGKTRQDLFAEGTWPEIVLVHRIWPETLAAKPNDVAVTTVCVREGKLWGRDYGFSCSVGAEPPDEDVAMRRKNVEAAMKFLSRYVVTEAEIEDLILSADTEKGRLWSPDDGRIAEDIARSWLQLFSYGVEPSEIRQLLHRKSRELWKRPPSGSRRT